MKQYRLNRLFNAKSNRCFDVAIDHGVFNEYAFLQGIENIEQAVKVLVEADPDAIQVGIGQAPVLQAIPGKRKPALVLRTDVANVYGSTLPAVLYSRLADDVVEQAVRLDAACVVVNLMRIPDHPEITDQCVQNVLKLRAACDRYAMPLMVEPLVMQANEKGGGYMVDGDVKKIIPLVRQAVEFGADVVKADPTDDPSIYHKVIETAGRIPVLVRGGGKVSDVEILKRTEAVIKQGAAGIVYGRNIVQHPRPGAITRALMAVVHDNMPAEQAAAMLNG